MAKKKKKKARGKKKISQVRPDIDSDVMKGVWSILLIAGGILAILSFFDKAGTVGSFLETALRVLFGWGMYIIPLLLFGLAVAFIFSWHRDTNKSAVFAALLFFIGLLGVFSITNYGEAVERGGYFGFAVAWPLVNFIGTIASYVVLLSVMIAAMVIGFHIRVDELARNFLEQRKRKKGALEIKTSKQKQKAQPQAEKKKEDKKEEVEVKDYHEEAGQDEKEIKEKEEKKKKKDSKSEFVELPQTTQFPGYELPSPDLLEKESGKPTSGDIKANANIIQRTLQNFGVEVEMAEVNVGPTVTQYTLKPAEGVKLSKITALGNDLALALAAHPIRVEAPIPGRSLVGIEIPNKAKAWVRLHDLIDSEEFHKQKGNLVLAMGRNVRGKPVYTDLARMPHMLIAGSTGAGKTIGLNTMILSLLYRNPPQFLRLILIDPKRVEFTAYQDIPHLLAPIVVDNNKAVNALKWAVNEMERRFEVLSEAHSRDIVSYNSKKHIIKEGKTLPYIVIVIDELADLMSSKGREVEALIVRIAQMARAVGIHLVLATQRPSVEVITGLIKANITARVAFQVASQVDSRTVLDVAGAERLLGKGDMLYLSPEHSKPLRVQGAFVDEPEVKRVTDHLRSQKKKMDESDEDVEMEDFGAVASVGQSVDFENVEDASEEDELYGEAKELVVKAKKASASYLQRRLKVGYARAARLLDMLEENGVVGPADGAKPREVFVTPEELAGGVGEGEGAAKEPSDSDYESSQDEDSEEEGGFYG